MNQPLKTLLLAALGALPGILLLVFVGREAGGFLPAFIILTILGGLIGGLLSLPGVSGGNVLKGLLGMVIARNIPGGADLFEKMTEGSPEAPSEPILKNNRFIRAEVPRSLEDLQQQHIFSVEEVSVSIDKQQQVDAAVIESVAPFSLAAALELQPGDLLCKFDELNGGDVEWRSVRNPAADYTYLFHRASPGRAWRVVASGAPLGCEFDVTDEALAKQVEEGDLGFADLQNLWRRGHWQWLERGTSALLEQADEQYRPPLEVLHAAALYELGRTEDAIERHRNYMQTHASGYVVSFGAIAGYYLGLHAFAQGNAQEGEALLRDAYDAWDLDRFAEALERYGCPRPQPDQPRWEGQKLPLEYELQSLAGGKVSLAEQLKSMEPHQVTTLCILGDYRANGPYAGFIRDFRRWYTFFPHYFPALHVITYDANEVPEDEDLLEGERTARAHGMPLEVLSDPDGLVSQAVGPSYSPFLLMVDRNGQVLSEGQLDEAKNWGLLRTLIARACRMD